MENFERALSLMGIGMITVFLVLCLVVLAGNFLIWLINRYGAPGNGGTPKPIRESVAQGKSTLPSLVSPTEIAVITSAVFHVTKGQGKIERIERK